MGWVPITTVDHIPARTGPACRPFAVSSIQVDAIFSIASMPRFSRVGTLRAEPAAARAPASRAVPGTPAHLGINSLILASAPRFAKSAAGSSVVEREETARGESGSDRSMKINRGRG